MDLSFLEGLTRRELLQWIEDHIQGDTSPSLVLTAMPVDESEIRSSSDSKEPWLEFESFDQFREFSTNFKFFINLQRLRS